MSERLFRLDPRLVHATLMNAWVPVVRPARLVVADAGLVQDSRRRAILEMSAMDAVPLDFVAEEQLAACLEGGETPALVLFSSLEAVERALRAGAPIDVLTIGHLPEGPGRRMIHPAVHLSADDDRIIAELDRRGVKVFAQPLPRDPPRPLLADARPARLEARLQVVNERGLHLRAAHALAHLAGGLKEDIKIGYEGELVNAKSLLGLTTLGAGHGAWLDVVVSGADPERALEAITNLFASGFHEGVLGGGEGP